MLLHKSTVSMKLNYHNEFCCRPCFIFNGRFVAYMQSRYPQVDEYYSKLNELVVTVDSSVN